MYVMSVIGNNVYVARGLVNSNQYNNTAAAVIQSFPKPSIIAKLGGFVGQQWGTITGSYWDTESSSIATSPAGSGLTTAK
jgi:hypothetical protein